MRQIVCGEIQTSVLGFGCGSVLGRVGRSASLRAMNSAWDAGITLFDTARSYGYGEAESLLGEFLRGKREQAVVATKYGLTPRRLGALERIALPFARLARQAPGVRTLQRRSSPQSAIGDFTADGLRASVETSLRALQTDRIDLLFLHEATADAIGQHDLLAALDALRREGKLKRAGLYASAEVVAACIANAPPVIGAMQFGANLFHPLTSAIAQNNRNGMLLIANHPFGGPERVARFRASLSAIAADESTPTQLRRKLHDSDPQAWLEALFGALLNGSGIHSLVFSMMCQDHLRANIRAVESCRFSADELELICARVRPDA
jgi:aryl-alcohol dehydrogenase-like predicted oxidoreductase